MTHDQSIAALFPDGAPSDYGAYALILPLTAVQAMHAAQEAVATTDGRFFIGADILPELAPGGIFEPALPLFNTNALSGTEVMPWADAIALLPIPNEEDFL